MSPPSKISTGSARSDSTYHRKVSRRSKTDKRLSRQETRKSKRTTAVSTRSSNRRRTGKRGGSHRAKPESWPSSEPWPPSDSIVSVTETLPPYYHLKSGREIAGELPVSLQNAQPPVFETKCPNCGQALHATLTDAHSTKSKARSLRTTKYAKRHSFARRP